MKMSLGKHTADEAGLDGYTLHTHNLMAEQRDEATNCI
jgi:hypothetical protein